MFDDVRDGVPGCVAKGQHETKSQITHTYENRVDRKPNISCKICGKAHQTHNCWNNKNKRVSAGAEIASRSEFHSPNQGKKWQNRGRNWNLGRNKNCYDIKLVRTKEGKSYWKIPLGDADTTREK